MLEPFSATHFWGDAIARCVIVFGWLVVGAWMYGAAINAWRKRR